MISTSFDGLDSSDSSTLHVLALQAHCLALKYRISIDLLLDREYAVPENIIKATTNNKITSLIFLKT